MVRPQQTFVEQDRFCVPESMTVELPPDRQGPVSRAVGACGNYVSQEAMTHNTISCGPCGFVFDPDVTEAARAYRADACCYEVSSPPPPRPPDAPTPIDPRYACENNGDCVASCHHGAVAGAWWQTQYPGDEGCEDGCTSKGTEPPICSNRRCVARRNGADDPGCTQVDARPLEGPGPAHRCVNDEDCTNDCALGAINAEWFARQDRGPACRDGCTAKGTEAARCEKGRCVAYRLGARHHECTGRSIWEH